MAFALADEVMKPKFLAPCSGTPASLAQTQAKLHRILHRKAVGPKVSWKATWRIWLWKIDENGWKWMKNGGSPLFVAMGWKGKNHDFFPRLWKGLREAARELHMHKEIPILLRQNFPLRVLQLGDWWLVTEKTDNLSLLSLSLYQDFAHCKDRWLLLHVDPLRLRMHFLPKMFADRFQGHHACWKQEILIAKAFNRKVLQLWFDRLHQSERRTTKNWLLWKESGSLFALGVLVWLHLHSLANLPCQPPECATLTHRSLTQLTGLCTLAPSGVGIGSMSYPFTSPWPFQTTWKSGSRRI